MGISFSISSVREGTVFNVMQFLSLERVTGVLKFSFGNNIPEAIVYLDNGNLLAAEFGSIFGNSVLDVLLCQEYAVKEIIFTPERLSNLNIKAKLDKADKLDAVILNVSKDVDMCKCRHLIYGALTTKIPSEEVNKPLLSIMYSFDNCAALCKLQENPNYAKQAPLHQCTLIHQALTQNLITYEQHLVPIKSFKILLEILNPLTEKELNSLRGYMKSLLPHPKATNMSLERFYAFASAIESLAQRKSPEIGSRARKAIHELVNIIKSKDVAKVKESLSNQKN